MRVRDLLFPLARVPRRRARRVRGRAGEDTVARGLDEFAARYGVKVRHSLPLTSRRRRRGDLDHALIVGKPVRFFVAVETKAERPKQEHLEQVRANAERASRRHFRGAPQYRIVVHPNSNEPVDYDPLTGAARMGYPHLAGYLRALLNGAHRDRLVP